jgi:hypothetical protein
MYKLLILCGALAFGLLLALPAHTCAQQWPQPTAETAAIIIEPPEKDVEEDSAQPQAATVVNGDFESGNLSGWSTYNSTTAGSWRNYTSTATPVKRLRFRIVDITSGPAAAGTADLRVLSSSGTVTDSTGTVVATINGLRLKEPPNQDAGGGLNSTLRAGTIDLRTPLAPGASIDVQFLLGVQTGGTYRFFVSVEPLD